MTAHIVVLDGSTVNPGDNPWTPVEAFGSLTVYDESSPDDIANRLADADVAVVNKARISADVLSSAPKLKLIAVTATGYDCVDVPAARSRGVLVVNLPTYGTDTVAQFAFALLLELCHRVGMHDAAVHGGEWQRRNSFSFRLSPQLELATWTLGIIGFGRIGRRVGEIGHAFGMRILACDQLRGNTPDYQPFAWATQREVAEESDVVTLHCNLTPGADALVNREFLQLMKPSAFLVNSARGALVDEQALADAMNSGQLAGAAVDVVSSEPPTDGNPLLTAKNCIITPHIAWSSLAARRRMMHTTAENIRSFLAGAPKNVVN